MSTWTAHEKYGKPCLIYSGKKEHLGENFGATLCGRRVGRWVAGTHEPDPIWTCRKCLAVLREHPPTGSTEEARRG